MERKLRSRRRDEHGRRRSQREEEQPQVAEARAGPGDDEPLIDPTIVNLASQRMIVVFVFVLVQCCKVYDVVMLKTGAERSVAAGLLPLNNFTFVLKYAIAEGLFLWTLPILNVPYLTFSPLKTILLTVVLNGFTFVLGSDTTIPVLSSIVLPMWNSLYKRKELTLLGESASPQSIIDMSTHFKGRYTVHYLPDLSARFNPFQFDDMCLTASTRTTSTDNTNGVIYMPIEFNTTNQLGSLSIQHVDVTNQVSYINFTSSELVRLARRDHSHLKGLISRAAKLDYRVFHIEVPLRNPGSYRIHTVTDSMGINIRTTRTAVLISNCPYAKLEYPKAAPIYSAPQCIGGSKHLAVSDLELPLVTVFGVTPLSVRFSVDFNGAKMDDFTVSVGGFGDGDEAPQRTPNDLTWLNSVLITRNLVEQGLFKTSHMLSPGMVALHLTEVVDSMGHTMRYNPISKDREVFHMIEIRKQTLIQFESDASESPILINGTKTLHLKTTEDLKSVDFPLRVEFEHFKSTRDSATKFTKVFGNQQDFEKGLKVDKAGAYAMLSGAGKFCPCDVDKSNSVVEVALAPLPQVSIEAEPIVDKCIGMTGYQFGLNFSGKPPFQVQYQVFEKQPNGVVKPMHNENGSILRFLKSFSPRFDFTYKPPREGTYLVVFSKLKDMNYVKSPVQLDEKRHTYETYFKQRSRAGFNPDLKRGHGPIKINSCLNDASSVPLYLQGNPPFAFKYSIVEKSSGRKLVDRFAVSNVLADQYLIQTPKFERGGEFQIILHDLKDSLSCDIEFDAVHDAVTVVTRHDIPTLSFQSDYRNKTIKIIEGESIMIPLELKLSTGASSNDWLAYKIKDSNGTVTEHTQNAILSLRVHKEGVYSLTSFANSECSGKVANEFDVVTVKFYPRPTLDVVGDLKSANVLNKIGSSIHLKPICEKCPHKITLNLIGAAPFIIDYDIHLPSGKVESRTMNIEGSTFVVHLPSAQGGRYKHVFKKIFDKFYTRENAKGLNNKAAKNLLASVTYDVHPLPDAIVDGPKFSQICESNVNRMGTIAEIPVKFVGSYPFEIKLTLTHESTGKSDRILLRDIMGPQIPLNQHHESMSVGNHIVTIDELKDSNGCVQKKFSPLNNFILSITAVPSIDKVALPAAANRSHYCVGDHINYNMSGIPPFTVYYDFNGRQQKAEMSPPVFQRLASSPGNLSITGLLDSSVSKCLVNFPPGTPKHEELKLRIHQLPLVEVNEGNYIVENIHEGDQTEIVFTFEGVPPFTLTYIRTVDAGKDGKRDHHSRVVEEKTITGIWDYEYSVLVNQQGTYEAIAVSDAYCTAKRDFNA